jgi:hypothetical protein
MYYIGHGPEVAKHDDVKGWEMSYDQVTALRYGRNNVSEERNRENKHWEQCRLRLRPGGAKEWERCGEVEKRMSKYGLEWRWNDVLGSLDWLFSEAGWGDEGGRCAATRLLVGAKFNLLSGVSRLPHLSCDVLFFGGGQGPFSLS